MAVSPVEILSLTQLHAVSLATIAQSDPNDCNFEMTTTTASSIMLCQNQEGSMDCINCLQGVCFSNKAALETDPTNIPIYHDEQEADGDEGDDDDDTAQQNMESRPPQQIFLSNLTCYFPKLRHVFIGWRRPALRKLLVA
ncbi:hypothetical protein GX48_06794 [Paracoccidioides brasiliensis]|nr:hypothetical protein GX48_06794 [Paracoccidioides brasiliensis]